MLVWNCERPSPLLQYILISAILVEGSNVLSFRHASVVRGRVVTSEGAPIPNVKVAVTNQPQCGYTLTRADGWSVKANLIKKEYRNEGAKGGGSRRGGSRS